MPKEQWRLLEYRSRKLLVSNHGQVKWFNKSSGIWVDKKTRTVDGYLATTINYDFVFVHTLVLTAFVGPRPPSLEARHLNGNPQDNRWPENLAWGTHSENEKDKIKHGTNIHKRDQRGRFTPKPIGLNSRIFE